MIVLPQREKEQDATLFEDNDGVRNMTMEPAMRRVIRTDTVYQVETEKGVDGYPQTAVDLAANYGNDGILVDANAIGMAGRSKRGENSCQLSFIVDPKTEVIKQATFCATGALGMIAAATATASMCEGKTIDEALKITDADILERLGGDMPRKAVPAPFVAMEAIRSTVGDYLLRQGATIEELDRRCPCNTNAMSCILCEHCSLRESRIDAYLASFKK